MLTFKPIQNNYQFSQPALKVLFGILGSFYTYLLQEQIIQANPLALIRQKASSCKTNQNAEDPPIV